MTRDDEPLRCRSLPGWTALARRTRLIPTPLARRRSRSCDMARGVDRGGPGTAAPRSIAAAAVGAPAAGSPAD